jgi:hypothetical protein
MARWAAGVIEIAIIAVNGRMAALFLSDARHAPRRGCDSRTQWQQIRSCRVPSPSQRRQPTVYRQAESAAALREV